MKSLTFLTIRLSPLVGQRPTVPKNRGTVTHQNLEAFGYGE